MEARIPREEFSINNCGVDALDGGGFLSTTGNAKGCADKRQGCWVPQISNIGILGFVSTERVGWGRDTTTAVHLQVV